MRKIVKTMLLMAICMLFTDSHVDAARNSNWKTIFANEIWGTYGLNNNLTHKVKYGKYSLERVGYTLYIQGAKIDTSVSVKSYYNYYGGVISNGTSVIYQKGKVIYLWKPKAKKKLFSVGKKDTLIGRYGNNFYVVHNVEYDDNELYIYNIKTKKKRKTKFYNAYYMSGKYVLVNGQFHEGCDTELILYNAKTRKTTFVDKKASFGSAGIISGNNIYYSTLNETKWTWKIVKYNIKTKKKVVLRRGLKIKPIILDSKYYCYVDRDKSPYTIMEKRIQRQ